MFDSAREQKYLKGTKPMRRWQRRASAVPTDFVGWLDRWARFAWPTLQNQTATNSAAAFVRRFLFAGSNSDPAASAAVSATSGLRETMAATMAPSIKRAS